MTAVATFALPGCSLTLEPENAFREKTMGQVELTACLEDNETKTVYREIGDGNGEIWWTPGDAISLFYGSGSQGGNKFTSISTEPSKITNFTGNIGVITGGGEIEISQTYFWGVYPYRPEVSCDGKAITTVLPSKQVSADGSFAPGQFPTMGRSSGLVMSFYNICSGVRFYVTDPDIRSVTIKATGGEPLAGTACIDFDDAGLPRILEIRDGCDEVTVTPQDGTCFVPGEDHYYYAILPPTTLSSGLTVTYKKLDKKATYTVGSSQTFNRGKFKNIKGKDAGLEFVESDDPIEFADPNFKAWCVERYDYNGDGEIQISEAATVSHMSIYDNEADPIESIEGIKFFTNLNLFGIYGSGAWWEGPNNSGLVNGNYYDLTCPAERGGVNATGRLKSADFSGMSNLVNIRIQNCALEQINLNNCENLNTIFLNFTRIHDLDTSPFSNLEYLEISYSSLEKIDLSKNTSLSEITISGNLLSSLDVSANTVLTSLYCENNLLSYLEVSKNSALTYFNCASNLLTSLEVGANPNLLVLDCGGNNISELDISANPALQHLYCPGNYNLELLRVAEGCSIEGVTSNRSSDYIPDCTQIVYEKIPEPKIVEFEDDVFKSYCVSNFDSNGDGEISEFEATGVTYLEIDNCGLTSLKGIEYFKNLYYLYCPDNNLTSVDLSENVNLEIVYLDGNNLKSLDLSALIRLRLITAYENSSLSTIYLAEGQTISEFYYDKSITEVKIATPKGASETLDGDDEDL